MSEITEQILDLTRTHPVLRVALILIATLAATLVAEWVYRLVFRRFASGTASSLDDTVFGLLHPPIRNSVVLLGLSACVHVVDWPPAVETVLVSTAKTLAILIWTVALTRALSVTIRHLGTRDGFRFFQVRTVPLFDTLQKVVLAGAATYVVFLVWSIDVTGWVASAGIIGIAVGFAAKDSLANLFSGVFILADAPYKIGDMIRLDTGERGRVTEIGIRSTRILTRDDVEIIIPNAAIGVAKVTNESGGPHRKRRVDVRVGVSYSSDIVQVRRILEEVAAELDIVCVEPAPRVRFREMGDSSLIFSILFWIVDPEERGRAVDQVNSRVFERFREEGVEIPFPQRVIHAAPGTGGTFSPGT